MPNQHQIKTIFLDWNKTLSYSLFWGHLTDETHSNHHIETQISTWLFQQNRHVINPWMRGQLSSEEICTNISLDTGIDKDLIFSELEISCKSMEFCHPQIPEIINQLREKGYKVVIATDNMDTFRS